MEASGTITCKEWGLKLPHIIMDMLYITCCCHSNRNSIQEERRGVNRDRAMHERPW